jgi:paired amphipathic helix protein Sin3a
VNLFTQDFIDRARLVRESRSFLGEGELMAQFKEILGWDEAMERSALAKEREELYQPPGRPLTILDRPSREELNIRYGSYRRLPADVRVCRLVLLSGHDIWFCCAGNQCRM